MVLPHPRGLVKAPGPFLQQTFPETGIVCQLPSSRPTAAALSSFLLLYLTGSAGCLLPGPILEQATLATSLHLTPQHPPSLPPAKPAPSTAGQLAGLQQASLWAQKAGDTVNAVLVVESPGQVWVTRVGTMPNSGWLAVQYQSDSWDIIGRAPGCWLHKPALSSTMPGKTSVKLPHRATPKMCAR